MFETLIDEVKELDGRINEESLKNPVVKDLYYGCEIFFSPLPETVRPGNPVAEPFSPDLMFLGINPGAGGIKKGEPVHRYVPMDEGLCHLSWPGDGLSNSVNRVFTALNYDLEEKLQYESFKTNCYFFPSPNANQLWALISALPKELQNEIVSKAKKWIQEMIQTVSPGIIICEGIKAFKKLHDFYGRDMQILVGTGDTREAKLGNIDVLGFSRHASGRFKNEAACITKLKEYL